MSVAITPNGRADAVTRVVDSGPVRAEQQHCFCLPLEKSMPFEEFASYISSQAGRTPPAGFHECRSPAGDDAAVRSNLALGSGIGPGRNGRDLSSNEISSGGGEVWYVQHQNNSLVTEFSALLPDVDPHLPWATGETSSLASWAGCPQPDPQPLTSEEHYVA